MRASAFWDVRRVAIAIVQRAITGVMQLHEFFANLRAREGLFVQCNAATETLRSPFKANGAVAHLGATARRRSFR